MKTCYNTNFMSLSQVPFSFAMPLPNGRSLNQPNWSLKQKRKKTIK